MNSGDLSDREARLRVMNGVQIANEALIRAYDLKAEIAMLSFVLSVEAVNVLANLEHVRSTFPRLAFLLTLLFLAAVSSYMYVLLPRIRFSIATGYLSRGVLFVDPARHSTVDAYLKALTDTDLEREVANQVLELADICAVKRFRFLLAISLTATFYTLLLVTCLAA